MGLDVAHFGQGGGREPVIAAMGTINPLAATPYQTWAFRRAEVTAFVGSPFRLPEGGPLTFGRVRQLDPRMIGDPRMVALATRAVSAIGDSLERIPTSAQLGMSICLPLRADEPPPDGGSAGRLRRAVESAVIGPFLQRGFDVIARTTTGGQAAFGYAVKEAGRLLDERRLELVLIVAVDSYYDPFVLDDLIERQKVLAGEWRESFVPGEAAVALLLTRPDVASQLGLDKLGTLVSVGTNEEVATEDNEVGLLGLGLSRPAVACTKRLKEEGRTLDWWLSDATGETLRIQEMQLVWPRAAHLAMRKDRGVDLLPSHFGDTGAATMALGSMLAVEGMRRGDPSGRTALITGSSPDGKRAVVMVSATPP